MNNIKALTLKTNMVQNGKYYAQPFTVGEGDKEILVPGDPLKYMVGLPILVGRVDCFIWDIKFCRKDSDFVKECGIATGCYVIRFAAGSKEYCTGEVYNQSLIIMEDVVATVLIQQ